MPEPLEGKGRYIAGLDGLRAIAVLAVILYHIHPAWAPGGLLGVGVFFVLSGYLITDIIANEWKKTGRIDLQNFWLRRFRRLIPAMLAMIASVLLWMMLFDISRLQAIGGDALAAVMYVSNWRFIFHQVSYFEQFGPPSPLGHLWSLAVEEQFYLLWPFLLSLGLRFAPRRWQLAGMILVAAAVSAIAMAVIYEPGIDPSRVYYGTDTRAFALLIGAALAVVWPSRKLVIKVAPGVRLLIDAIGWAGLLSVLLMIGLTDQYDGFLYRGGLVLLSLVTAAAVASIVHPASSLNRALGWKPLQWLGVRSYGIYLWHYPVIALSGDAVSGGELNIARAFLQLAASFGLAALSWKVIEEPIRLRAAGAAPFRSGAKSRKTGGLRRTSRFLVAGCAFLVVVMLSFGIARIPDATASYESEAFGLTEPPEPAPAPTPAQEQSEDKPAGDAVAQQPAETPKPSGKPAEPSAAQGSGSAETQGQEGKEVTVIGDSVMLGVSPYLEELLPGIVIDAKVGRQMSQAQTAANQLQSENKLGDFVIIELGTNGTFDKPQLEKLLNSLGKDRSILLVNTRVPRPWEDDVNQKLEDTAALFPNVTVLDWHSASKGKSDYFTRDGVHLEVSGAKAYASLVAKAVADRTSRAS
ncbi:acyltransferase family protein [Paenibacillus sp. MBLB4367]|uniref:acyltransferase family protein n=1 Tax=Paenibacillus sp. MBLB4367 TaxID=3384767 RepID=UPI00390837FA